MTPAQLITVIEWLLIALGTALVVLVLVRGVDPGRGDGLLLGFGIGIVIVFGLLLMTKWPS